MGEISYVITPWAGKSLAEVRGAQGQSRSVTLPLVPVGSDPAGKGNSSPFLRVFRTITDSALFFSLCVTLHLNKADKVITRDKYCTNIVMSVYSDCC